MNKLKELKQEKKELKKKLSEIKATIENIERPKIGFQYAKKL